MDHQRAYSVLDPEEYPYFKNSIPNRVFSEKKESLKKLIHQIMIIIIVAISLIFLYVVFMTFMSGSKLPSQPEKSPKFEEDYIEMEELAREYDNMRKFEEFKHQYGKKYKNQEEENTRYQIFKTEMAKVERMNRVERVGKNLANTTVYGMNGFSDMSEDEFKKMLMPIDSSKNLKKLKSKFLKPLPPHMEKAGGHSLDDYPPHFDWRVKNVVTPVKSQANCGSCWAFAAVATVESAHAIKYGELKNLSSQQLLDCDLSNDACDGGDDDRAFAYVHEHGLMTWEDYPYVAARQNTCRLHGNDTTSFMVAYQLNPDELTIIDWLVNYGPVNIGINVPPDMKPYKGGIYRPTDYDCQFKILGTHALNIVGYGATDAGEKYWIIKNSWGQNWGVEGGYYYMARGVNSCGVEDEPIGLIA